jgi:hypothetical protein
VLLAVKGVLPGPPGPEQPSSAAVLRSMCSFLRSRSWSAQHDAAGAPAPILAFVPGLSVPDVG